MITGTYHGGFVALSVLIAIVASYAAFSLGERVSASSGQRRWAWLTSGAIAMGFAIWSMHYVGMLAFVLPVPVVYHVPTVILSLIAPVLGAAVALYIVSKKTMQRVNTAVAGLCLGGAIAAMHYIGMAAMRSSAMHHYRLSLVILSVVVAITFSLVAAWLTFRFGKSHHGFTWTKISGALLMGLGIASMHYTAMAAAYFVPGHTPPIRHTVEVSTLGAFGIGMTTLLLLGTVLVTLWWDRQLANERLLHDLYRDLRDVINTVPAHAWSTLPDGEVDFVNQRWQQFTGLPAENSLGWNWEALLHPDDRARLVADWRAALNGGQSMEAEVRVRRADGEYRCLLVRNVPQRDERGNIVKWYGTGLDIEDRKRAESLLGGEKRILEMLAKGDSLPEILDTLCRFAEEQASGGLVSILLLDDDRLRHGGAPSLPKGYTDAIDGALIGPSAGSCGTAAYRGEQVIVEDIATDPLWANYRDLALPHSLRACWSTPVVSSQGKVIATFAVYYHEPRRPNTRDLEIIEQITHLAGVAIERKLAQDALRTSEAYLAEAQRLAHLGSWVWKIQGREAVYLSEEWYRIYGFQPEDGLPNWDERLKRIHPEDRAKWQEAIDRAIRNKSDYEVEFRILLPTGMVKYVRSVGHPVTNPSGDLVKFVGISTDMTDRKRAEEERERLYQLEADLVHMNRISMLGELVASLSHELKQPITAAITNAKTCLRWLARAEPDLEEAREAVARVVQDGNHAAEVISHLRSLYTKGSPAERELVDVNELIREMLALVRNEANRKVISMRTALAAELPPVVADRVQLQQVFMNLMLNGIEAMNETGGELTIKSQLMGDGQLLISVCDTGVGLPAEKAERIFDAFFTTKPQGSGMGLAISRSIVESHHGRLWATRNSARGTTFHFTLPTDLAASPSSAA
jgi:PAS domain S-box-containing protein